MGHEINDKKRELPPLPYVSNFMTQLAHIKKRKKSSAGHKRFPRVWINTTT